MGKWMIRLGLVALLLALSCGDGSLARPDVFSYVVDPDLPRLMEALPGICWFDGTRSSSFSAGTCYNVWSGAKKREVEDV